MLENYNNQLVSYQNQIPQNQDNQANIVLKQERKEVSFEIDQKFLQSSLNKFLEQNFKKIQNIENNNQNIMQLYNIFQILGQEIIKLKNELTEAFAIQEEKINNINDSKEDVIKNCSNFFDKWQKEDSINKENLEKVQNILKESNNKIEMEIGKQSKKLDESIQKNKLENENIKSEFQILNSNLNLAENKNNGYEKLIKNLLETCNNNNRKIIELETKLTNIENNYKNNKEIINIKANLDDYEIKINNNLNNISNIESKFKKNKEENDNKTKEIKEKMEEMNEVTYKKFDEITKEINKVKNDIINKKTEGLKIKDDKTHNKILDNLKEQINEFIQNNNKEMNK